MLKAAEDRPNGSEVLAQKRFSGYKSGNRQRAGIADVKEDEVLKQLMKVWTRFKTITVSPHECKDIDDFRYYFALDMVKGMKYSCEDIEQFSIVIGEGQTDVLYITEMIGLFLSALINNCEGSDYTLHTGHLRNPPDFIGYRNIKHVTVEGDVGSLLGNHMERGKITVKGDSGDRIGNWMTGGEIYVEGEIPYPDFPFFEHGKIFVKGKLAVDK